MSDDDAVLAIVESLRAYSAQGSSHRPLADVAVDWYRGQLFPPPPALLQRALDLMAKSRPHRTA